MKVPVPQTDTGRWDEKSKARERTFVKELGKMTPYLRETGCHGSVNLKLGEHEVAAEKRPKRLFIKNTGTCKVERRRIGADACPVPEG